METYFVIDFLFIFFNFVVLFSILPNPMQMNDTMLNHWMWNLINDPFHFHSPIVIFILYYPLSCIVLFYIHTLFSYQLHMTSLN